MTLIFGLNMSAIMNCQLTYLLLEPDFSCEMQDAQGNWKRLVEGAADFDTYCKSDYFCKHPDLVHWQRNDASNISLNNWILKYDMVCSSLIPDFGMAFFTGIAVSSMFLASLGDKHGRKKVVTACMFVNLFVFIGFYFMPSDPKYLFALIALFAIQGLEAGGITAVGFCYFVELSPQRYAPLTGTLWNMSYALNFIIITLVYAYVNKNWEHSVLAGIIIQLFCIVFTVCFIPESPKWLFEMGEYEKC
jgi:MFS family permease